MATVKGLLNLENSVLNLRLDPDEDFPLLPPVLYDAASADIPEGFPLPWNNYQLGEKSYWFS